MCRPASFVITEGEVLFSKISNSHEDIIEENNLNDKTAHPAFVRVEISPENGGYKSLIKKWIYNVDQDLLPKWYDAKQCEKRCRAALKKWKKYHCCTQKGKYPIGGFRVTQESGNCSTQIAENRSTQTSGGYSTQTAGDHSTQTAGYYSTQTAGNRSTQTAEYCSTQKAGDHSTQKAEYCSIQTAGGWSTQTAGSESIQTAGKCSTQTARGYSIQKATAWSNQTAGDHSTQIASNESSQTAGDYSYQTAKDWSIQTAGIGTIQIGKWRNRGIWKVVTRTVTEEEANKPYRFSGGEWRLLESKKSV